MANRSASATQEKQVNDDLIVQSLAKAIHDGDIVNFRLIFAPFSPARKTSTERYETEKYAYLLPDDELANKYEFRQIVKQVQERDTWRHVQEELDARRPPRLPSNLMLQLADNAVRQGKYTSASQAYEMLRIRSQMQGRFYSHADAALDKGDIRTAVRGYIIATGLEYNYAAFPEPLPVVPDWQKRALMLHGEYPMRPEDSLPLQDLKVVLRTALSYLLLSAEAAARLEDRDLELKLKFLEELVRARDPKWDDFAARYREAADMMREFARQANRSVEERAQTKAIEQELERHLDTDPMRIPQHLLGRAIPQGEWWQYLKELAYEHPAAALFVSRQLIGDTEIIMPRYRADSPLPKRLGLAR